MQKDRLPGVYYKEDVAYELTGEGSKIPVIIGATNNVTVPETKDESGNITQRAYKADGTVIRKYTGWNEINVSTQAKEPGIGEWSEGTTNQLLKFCKEFFEEARLNINSDIGVPYVYLIDVGDGKSKDAWTNALELAKTKRDAIIEAYVGADNITGYTFKAFIEGAHNTIETETHDLDLRNGFSTIGYNNPDEVTDAQLIATTAESTGIQESRIGIMEPLLAGKTFARICCTPANTEPGFIEYRSVTPGTFKDRTKAEMIALQQAGIIFNRDEYINDEIHPKINLCVATSFRKSTMPADALFHARFNADDLLREVFGACYKQIKANESATNLAYLQTRINKIVNDRVNAEELIKWDEKTGEGTKLIASIPDNDKWSIIINGQIQSVRSTQHIDVEATLRI